MKMILNTIFSTVLLGGLLISFPFHHSQAAEKAEFGSVKTGVFKMKVGETIDLADRPIPLHLKSIEGNAGEAVSSVCLVISGHMTCEGMGGRVNLKENSNLIGKTKVFLKDVSNCFLDIASAEKPQGASASATFRLFCE